MRYQLAYTVGIWTAALIVAAFYAGGAVMAALAIGIYFVLPFAEKWMGESR